MDDIDRAVPDGAPAHRRRAANDWRREACTSTCTRRPARCRARCRSPGPRDVDDAVAAAREAFETWRTWTPWQRRDVLVRLADLLDGVARRAGSTRRSSTTA